jgi:chromosome segregation ATPase
MSDYQIDPYKLNEVLQQILDKLGQMDEKANSASPEFQVLMNNYLTKANEAERNQARFEEALERLDLAEQEGKKFKAENEELKERIRAYDRDFDSLRSEQAKEVNGLREELTKVLQSKNEVEALMSEKYSKELTQYRASAEKQISHLQTEVGEVLQVKRKLEEKLLMRTQESDAVERELSELKIKLADEQANIRNEIIEATKRSHQIEQRFQTEKEQMYKRVRELESNLEEITNALTLTKRELEYKDALLSQAMRKPTSDLSSLNVNKTANLVASQVPSTSYSTQSFSAPEVPTSEPIVAAETKEQKKGGGMVGGIWSKLNS